MFLHTEGKTNYYLTLTYHCHKINALRAGVNLAQDAVLISTLAFK